MNGGYDDVQYHSINSKKLFFNDNGKDVILTMYQVKVLAFKLRGYSIESIAKILNTSPDSVNLHMINIRKKIPVGELEGFTEKCINLGIYSVLESIYLSCLNSFLQGKG